MTLQERILMLFRGEPARWWTTKAAEDYYKAHPGVRFAPGSVRAMIVDLWRKTKLERRKSGVVWEYRFAEETPAVTATPMQPLKLAPPAVERIGSRDAMSVPSLVAPPERTTGRNIPATPASSSAVLEDDPEPVESVTKPPLPDWPAIPERPKPAPPKRPDLPPEPEKAPDLGTWNPPPRPSAQPDEILVPVRGAAINAMLRAWAKEGLLGSTPEEVAEYLLREAVWQRHA